MTLRILALFLIFAVVLSGCQRRTDARMYIYCSETFWYAMQDQALFFQRLYQAEIVLIPLRAERTVVESEHHVEIGRNYRDPVPWVMIQRDDTPVVPQNQLNHEIEDQIRRISQSQIGDLFLSDSQRQLDLVRRTGLSSREFHVCYLTLTMLVHIGNPHQLRSARDVLDSNLILGIMDPSFDGLGEASWQVLSRIVPGGEAEMPMNLIRVYERQYDLLEALEYGDIDAALVWNATSQISFLLIKYANDYYESNEQQLRQAERRRNHERLRDILQAIHRHIIDEYTFAEEVPLRDNPGERYVMAIQLVSLGSAVNFRHCLRFADYMRSNLAREILRRFGFVAE